MKPLLILLFVVMVVGVAHAEDEAHPLVHFVNGDRVYYPDGDSAESACRGWNGDTCLHIKKGKEVVDLLLLDKIVRIDWLTEKQVKENTAPWIISTKRLLK